MGDLLLVVASFLGEALSGAVEDGVGVGSRRHLRWALSGVGGRGSSHSRSFPSGVALSGALDGGCPYVSRC